MAGHDGKIKNVLKALDEGSVSVQRDPSYSNRLRQRENIERAAEGSNQWLWVIGGIGAVLFLVLVVLPALSRPVSPPPVPHLGNYESSVPSSGNTQNGGSSSSLSPSMSICSPASNSYCSDAKSTRLGIGCVAYVSYDPPQRNNVRSSAGMTYNLMGKIKPGEEIEIIDGPVCSDGYRWWKISSREQYLSGWTVEGDSQDYWLVPK